MWKSEELDNLRCSSLGSRSLLIGQTSDGTYAHLKNHTMSMLRSLFSRVPDTVFVGALFSRCPTGLSSLADWNPIDRLRCSPFWPEKRGMPSCCRCGFKRKWVNWVSRIKFLWIQVLCLSTVCLVFSCFLVKGEQSLML